MLGKSCNFWRLRLLVAALGGGCVGEGSGVPPAPRGQTPRAGAVANPRLRDTDVAVRHGGGVYARGLRWLGRADLRDPAVSRFDWSGSGFEARFSGTGLVATLGSEEDGLGLRVEVDGASGPPLAVARGRGSYVLASALPPGEHTLRLTRETEAQMGLTALYDLHVQHGELHEPPAAPPRLLEVVGDSVSAGYGNLCSDADSPFSFATESSAGTYGVLAARALGADVSVLAISGHGVFRNRDASSDALLPAVYVRAVLAEPRPRWQPARSPDAVVITLGANDLDAANDDPTLPMADAYLAFVEELRAMHPQALIVCAANPMEQGEATSQARLVGIVERVVGARRAAGDARVVPLVFPLLTREELGCDHHPSAAAHRRMAEMLRELLHAKLGW